MSLSERLFVRLVSAVRTMADPQAKARAARAFAPEPHRRHLELLASAVAGRRVRVLVAAGAGGAGGDTLVFPLALDACATAAANAELATLRAVVGGLLLRDPASARPPPAEQRELATCVALARALAALRDELPGAAERAAPLLVELLAMRPRVAELRGAELALEAAVQATLGAPVRELCAAAPTLEREPLAEIAAARWPATPAVPLPRPGRCPAVPLCGWLGEGLAEPAAPEPLPPRAEAGVRGGRERAGRGASKVRRRALDEREQTENPLTHSFEKVHTLEKYQGGSKRADGADELDAHGDALDELELDEVVRTATATAGVYRADVPGLELAAAEEPGGVVAPEALRYDEWDEGARAYRRGFCHVRVEHRPAESSPEAARRFAQQALARYRRERGELAEQLARLLGQPRRRGGQPDGPDVDLDALVERHGALRHGTSGPEKLYVARRRHPPELAVALLLDRSLSSDSWVANQRVLDVGADALVALGSALPPHVARTAALAFASHTRRDCRLAVLKSFDAPWSAAERRLAALAPEGYTRIGPALRHTTALLDREPARRKLLVLLSDGKPTDYDQYEGRYGLADVRQAVAEANRVGVFVFAVALDQRARGHLPRMFGPGGFAVVTRPRELVRAVGQLVRQRLAAQ